MISKKKWQNLYAWMSQLKINEQELIEKFITGSGKGGQKLHKTASVVYLKHIKTGIEIKCQESRYREDNRYFARSRLCERIQEQNADEKTKAQQQIAKIKRQKKRRSRKAKQKMLSDKSHQAKVKVLRKKPSEGE